MSTVLVTGGDGFLGRNVVEALHAAGHTVVSVDPRHATGRPPGGAGQIRADVTDPVALRRAFAPGTVDAVVHLAAATIGPHDDVAAGIRLNVVGTQTVLRIAQDAGVRRCLVLSSTAVFGDAVYGHRPLDEEMHPTPVSAYGVSKYAAESLTRQANAESPSFEAVVVRVPALFGPWERETPQRTLMSPPLQLVRALDTGEQVVLARGGHRDWTFAPDVAQAILGLLAAPRLEHETYHLGCGQTWNLAVLADLMVERNLPVSYTTAETTSLAYGDDLQRHRVPLDPSRAVAELGVACAPPRAACGRYLDWVTAGGCTQAPSHSGPPSPTLEKHHG